MLLFIIFSSWCFYGFNDAQNYDLGLWRSLRYVQYSAQWNDSFCIPMHSYELEIGGLSEEKNKDVKLV